VCKAVELCEPGHFYVFNKTLSLVERHFSGVELDLERVGSLNVHDFDWLAAVDLGLKSLNFSKRNVVTFFITVALVFVDRHSCFLLIAD
jgi:hypothetical protein